MKSGGRQRGRGRDERGWDWEQSERSACGYKAVKEHISLVKYTESGKKRISCLTLR